MDITNTAVRSWVEEIARLTKPDRIVWLNGSDEEYAGLLAEGVRLGQLIPLNPDQHPNSYLHRSHPQDVARTEQCTYVCTMSQDDAGPNNNWMAPDEAYATLRPLFNGIMRGRTMYVVPYLLGPAGSSFSVVGFELTDSVYVAVNMRIMTRMGAIAFERLGDSPRFVKGVHSYGALDPQQRYICHFPQDLAVWSINSGYGGNALLSKKCFALRLASWLGKREGWLAEHMFITGVEDPQGRTTYIAGAFPSACGKTNLAMLKPAGQYSGYKIWCVGDDIAWLRVGADGGLYATNPEAGFFGVAPGTNMKTNPNMMATIAKNTIFTNVALRPDQTVWWEGLDLPANVDGFLDWQGNPWDPASGHKAAHSNSRFTAPLTQCPIYTPKWNDPEGVPISAILFGARRSTLVPLVCEAFTWQHGVYLGATLNSETTAAAAGATGVVRRDPMAMLPFCGYNMADYFGHWLNVGTRLTHPPKIYRVNWFRVDGQGQFLWPGFGENMRVLKWIVDRCDGTADAAETPLGYLPTLEALDTAGLDLSTEALQTLFDVDRDKWLDAARRQTDFFSKFGDRLPRTLLDEQQALINRLKEERRPRWKGAGPRPRRMNAGWSGS
jgi:phosphoenolpyruvate carboxykinase (GTP)